MLFNHKKLAGGSLIKRHMMTIALGLVISTPALAQNQNQQGQQSEQECNIPANVLNNLQ
jgi:hypothetical protein